MKLYENPQLAAVVQEKYVQYEPTIDRSKIFCTKQGLFNYHIALKSRFGYYFMPLFDEVVLRLIEAGIPRNWKVLQIYENKWINTNASQYTLLKFSKESGFIEIESNKEQMISLSLAHIQGAIVILMTGYNISMMIFLFEINVQRYPIESRILHLLDFLLDPSR